MKGIPVIYTMLELKTDIVIKYTDYCGV
jgi:hypothetical protein